jgi:hypothetical protein
MVMAGLMPKKDIAERFAASLKESIPTPGAAQAVLDAYGINTVVSEEEACVNTLRFASDIGFFAPTLAFTTAHANVTSKNRDYLFRFNTPNPWPGPFQGFQNYNQELDEKSCQIAQEFAIDVIQFINGKDINLLAKDGSIVYGGKGGVKEFVRGKTGGNLERNSTILELGEKIGLDELSMAWGAFVNSLTG